MSMRSLVVAHTLAPGDQGRRLGLDIARGVGAISLMSASASNDPMGQNRQFVGPMIPVQCGTLDRLAIVRPLCRLAGTVDAAFEPRAARISLSAASQCCSASPSREPLATHISYARE